MPRTKKEKPRPTFLMTLPQPMKLYKQRDIGQCFGCAHLTILGYFYDQFGEFYSVQFLFPDSFIPDDIPVTSYELGAFDAYGETYCTPSQIKKNNQKEYDDNKENYRPQYMLDMIKKLKLKASKTDIKRFKELVRDEKDLK